MKRVFFLLTPIYTFQTKLAYILKPTSSLESNKFGKNLLETFSRAFTQKFAGYIYFLKDVAADNPLKELRISTPRIGSKSNHLS